MNAFKTLASLALLISTRLALVQAAVYVTNPVQSTVCHGGQSCEVDWVDDGQTPLLSSIGECSVGLYSGEMVLVQSLTTVDVSSSHSFSFTPDPSAGPNGAYFLVFTSNSISYQAWSGTFTLDGMTGSAGGSSAGISTSAGSSTTAASSAFLGSSLTPSATETTLGSSAGISTSAGSSTTAASSTLLGSSSSITGTTTSSLSTTSGTVSTPTTITTPASTGSASHSSTSTSTTSTTSATGAALRAGTSTSLAGGLVLALAGALIF